MIIIIINCRHHQRYRCGFLQLLSTSNFVLFQASGVKLLRTALFWVITQRVVVISYRRFGATCPSHPQGSRIKNHEDGTDMFSRNVSSNHHSSLHTSPEERCSLYLLSLLLWRYSLVLRLLDHIQLDTHAVGLLWMSNRPVAEAATYATHNTRDEHTPSLGEFEPVIEEIKGPQP